MMKDKTFSQNRPLLALVSLSLVTGISTLLSHIQPSQAENCVAFPVIGAEGTEVTKTVSRPGIPGPFGLSLNNNWNTDFSVIPLREYKKYIVTFIARSPGEFRIRSYLKYNDNTSTQIYDTQRSFTEDEVLKIEGTSIENNIPVQVNVFVGDPVSFGRTYTISVQGCM